MVAHYTLDDLTAGIQNRGTDGATSNLTVGGTVTTASDAMIGSGAARFGGAGNLNTTTPGNAADDLAGYPFTMSLWLRNAVNDTSRDAAMSVSRRALGDVYYNVGVGTNDAGNEVELVVRNKTFNDLNSSALVADAWRHVVAVFDAGGVQRLYVDGKLAATGNDTETFDTATDTLTLGAFIRNNTAQTDPYKGDIDDAGLFDVALSEAEIALANGLGRTGGIGLDQLDEAQALFAAGAGASGTVGGATWEYASGLSGTTGDHGGSVAAGTAYIVADASGNGIRVAAVPEPAGLSALALVAAGTFMRRRRGRGA